MLVRSCELFVFTGKAETLYHSAFLILHLESLHVTPLSLTTTLAKVFSNAFRNIIAFSVSFRPQPKAKWRNLLRRCKPSTQRNIFCKEKDAVIPSKAKGRVEESLATSEGRSCAPARRFELLFRNLNRRDSTLWSSLVSVEKAADEISSTGGPRRLSPITAAGSVLESGVPNRR